MAKELSGWPVTATAPLESCRADPVETICSFAGSGRCNTLHRSDGTLIAAAAPAGEEPRLTLDFLCGPRYANGEPASEDEYLDECGGSHAGDAMEMRAREGYADVAYDHARHDRDGALWLQYWFFYYYDDKGDWEMVQLRLRKGDIPPAGPTPQGRDRGATRHRSCPTTTTGSGRAWRRSPSASSR